MNKCTICGNKVSVGLVCQKCWELYEFNKKIIKEKEVFLAVDFDEWVTIEATKIARKLKLAAL